MLHTLKAEFYKFYYDVKRYLFNYLMGFISMAIFLGGLYGAVKYLLKSGGKEIAFIGLLLWLFVPAGITNSIEHITEERYLGTIERISTTKSSFIQILLCRFIVNFTFTFFTAFLTGIILWIVFRPEIYIFVTSWKTFLIISVTSLMIIGSIYGFGFFVSALGLIFKKVGAITSIIEYIILFLSGIIIPSSNFPYVVKIFSLFLPMTWGIKSLHALLKGGNFLFNFLNLILYTFFIIFIGYITFLYSIKYVKKKGEYVSF